MLQADFFLEPIVTAMLAAEMTDEASGLSCSPAAFPPPGSEGSPAFTGIASAVQEDLTKAPALATRLTNLLDTAKDKADMAGCPREYADAADFAVCALIDEVLLSSSWPGRDEWLRHPLQRLRHGTVTAGEDFYRLLDMLSQKADTGVNLDAASPPTPDQNALAGTLEVFALCLNQGFTGMYYHNTPAIRERIHAIARLVPGMRNAAWNEGQSFFSVVPENASQRKRNTFFLRFDLLDCLLWLLPPIVLVVLFHTYSSRLDALVEIIFTGKS